MLNKYKVNSLSEAGKVYQVTHFEETDKWVCECPSYIYHDEGFECKHIKQIRKGLNNGLVL